MSQQRNDRQTADQARRDFLRKSVYAAYAVPVITMLLVSEKSAYASTDKHCAEPTWAANHPQICGK